tara:strand:+ start:791 stop:1432 length:642 start_codon:yes stop_codon:yes gene_type:complete
MRTIQNSIILLLFFSFTCFAQENDFQTWHSVSLNKKIIKKINLSIKTGLRLRENSSQYSKQFTDVKIKRKYNKRFSGSLGYRYINKWDNALNISNQNRFYTDVNYKNRFSKRISYSLRNRWQAQGDFLEYKMTLRQKFTIDYNLKKTKLSPSIAGEYFLTLKDGVNKLRSTLGLGYPLSKKLDFELVYRIQHEFYVNNPQTLFIFEGKLAYSF